MFLFIKKRYKKILPFFALLCFIDLLICPSLASLYEAFANLTLCFGLITNANISIIGVGWFLGIVFVFYLLFPFFCFLISDKRRAWMSFVVSLLINYICKYYFGLDRHSIIFCFVFFMAGGMVYLYQEKVLEINHRVLATILLVLSTSAYYISNGATIAMLGICICALKYAVIASGKKRLKENFGYDSNTIDELIKQAKENKELVLNSGILKG